MKKLPWPLWMLKIRANFYKTILINFRLLPLRDAVKLPIVLIGNVKIKGCRGCVEWINVPKIHVGMLIVGELPDDNHGSFKKYTTRLKVQGKLVLEDHIHIRGGGSFIVGEKAIMTIGKDTMLNSFNRIWCTNSIQIGRNIRTSWEVQIFDSNFHYLIDEKGYTRRCEGNVIIGNNVWIGNRCTINKGSVLPDFCVVASGSIVNKDFSEYGEKVTIGGMPAKYLRSGFRRLFNRRIQQEVNTFFHNNPEAKDYYVGENVI